MGRCEGGFLCKHAFEEVAGEGVFVFSYAFGSALGNDIATGFAPFGA
jgi:hypothetical protein